MFARLMDHAMREGNKFRPTISSVHPHIVSASLWSSRVFSLHTRRTPASLSAQHQRTVYRVGSGMPDDECIGVRGPQVCGSSPFFVSTTVEAFDFKFRVSAPAASAGSFRLVSGGTGCLDYVTDLSGLVQVASTGGYNNYEEQSV